MALPPYTISRSSRPGNPASSFSVLLLVVVLITSSFTAGYYFRKSGEVVSIHSQVNNEESTATSQDKIDFSLFWDVWNNVQSKHYDKPAESNNLFFGAIKGMVAAINDPYTAFMDPTETKELQSELNGTFEGIGAEIGIRDGHLIVVSPLDGSPAEKSGLKPNDWIIAIDSKDTSNISLYDAVKALRGERGSNVTATIVRAGNEQPFDAVMTRDVIKIDAVKVTALQNGIYQVRISTFSQDAAAEFTAAVDGILLKNPKGIVLDVRNNPGGLLNAAVDIAGVMIPKGHVVVVEKSSNGSEKNMKAAGSAALVDMPVVVLINEGSASAAEILAGALRDDRNIKLVGQNTFGKGSVQDLEYLPQNTSLRVTVAKWFTPKKNGIDQVGLKPDVETTLTQTDIDADRDPQLEAAVDILLGKDI